MKDIKSPEEVLKDELSEYYWELIEAQITQSDGEMLLKKWILQAIQAYHSQFTISDEEIEKQFPRFYKGKFHRKDTPNVLNICEIDGAQWYRAEQERRGNDKT